MSNQTKKVQRLIHKTFSENALASIYQEILPQPPYPVPYPSPLTYDKNDLTSQNPTHQVHGRRKGEKAGFETRWEFSLRNDAYSIRERDVKSHQPERKEGRSVSFRNECNDINEGFFFWRDSRFFSSLWRKSMFVYPGSTTPWLWSRLDFFFWVMKTKFQFSRFLLRLSSVWRR